MNLLDRELLEVLAQNHIFTGLSAEEIGRVMPCLAHKLEEYSDGECVFEKGDQMRDLSIVLEGELMIVTAPAGGAQIATQKMEPSGLFGEVVVFSTDGFIPYRVVACGRTRILLLSGDFFRQQCSCGGDCANRAIHNEITNNMFRLLSDRVLRLGRQVSYLTAPDLRTKISMYLCELYELNRSTSFNMPLNRDRLADFFAVARPSLSREFAGLKSQRVIDYHRSSIEILDLNALYAIAHARPAG